jgi:hypothetical protein
MGVGTGIVVFAVGAILDFGVKVHTKGFNLHTIGVILMAVGAVAFVLSLIFWSSWGGFGTVRRRRTVVSEGGYVRDDLGAGAGYPASRREVVPEELQTY